MCKCPDEETLAGYVEGIFGPEEADRIEAHIGQCNLCHSWVLEARENNRILPPLWDIPGKDGGAQTIPGMIKGFEIQEEIGRGAMGVVYRALQTSPRREVALKVLLEGPFASEKSKRRFEREVEFAAQLNHAHIVTILESGIASKRYYFAMQYVDGQHLDDYLANRKLSIDDVLRLFGKICDAITYAHQRGVIHRDLKPSNILIDKEGVPHVLDFGLAKVAVPQEAALSQLSITGEVMGTLPYMSPEQATGSHRDIDVRTDVYSLGVILYVMLTGKYPYPVVGHVAEVLKNIAEAEPEKPSTIRRQINDEVETIVLKALAKEAARRYAGAGELAKDVERYLVGEPIDAKRDSTWYVIRKSLRRYRVGVGVAAAAVLLLVVSMIALSTMYEKQRRARMAEEEQRKIAEGNEAKAITAAARGEQVVTFLKEMLDGVSPSVALGRDTTMLREILDNTAERVGTELQGQPEVQAELRNTIGTTYRALGHYEQAESMLRSTLSLRKLFLGIEHKDVARSMYNLALVLMDSGDYSEANSLFRNALAMQRKLLGDSHLDVANTLDDLGALLNMHTGDQAAAETHFRQALVIRRRLLGNEHPDIVVSLNNLAAVLHSKADYAGAIKLHRESLALERKLRGNENPQVAVVLGNLASSLGGRGYYQESERIERQVLEMRRRLLGNDHPDTALALRNLAVSLKNRDDYAGAEPLFRESLTIRRKALGNDHDYTIWSMHALADVLFAQEKVDEGRLLEAEFIEILGRAARRDDAGAAELNEYAWLLLTCRPPDLRRPEEALEFAERAVTLPEGRQSNYLDTLAVAYQMTGDIDRAIETEKEALGLLAPDNWLGRRDFEDRMYGFYKEKGDFAAAEKVSHDALAQSRKLWGDEHKHVAHALDRLGSHLLSEEKYAEAEPILRECWEAMRKAYPEGNWRIPSALSLLGASLAGQGKFAEGEQLLLTAHSQMNDYPDAQPVNVKEVLGRLVNLYVRWGKPDNAAGYRAKMSAEEH